MTDILDYANISATADEQKLLKLKALRELGIEPYPHFYKKNINSNEIKKRYDHIISGEKLENDIYKIAGRLMLRRDMGGSVFMDIHDEFGKIQIYVSKSDLVETTQKLLPLLDIGDFIGIEGYVFRTNKGELSIHCREITLLSKSIANLPEKFHGLSDQELKYRQRFIDLAINPEQREHFKKRTMIISTIRKFLDERGFLEVETPILQPIYGGANAEPFTTHHNALDATLYLRISDELYLKRLIVGGFEKVYEIGHNFRNEGVDLTHNPEFTSIEWYEAYTDYNDQMERVEQLLETVSKNINNGSTEVTFKDMNIDFKAPFRRLSIYDALKQYVDIDAEKITKDEIIAKLKELHLDVNDKKSKGELLHELFEETCEKHLIQPTFIVDHRVEVSPLTKIHRTNNELVERFELYAGCKELANSYTELNDPIEQYKRLKQQEMNREFDN
jgi:lysyl-tRNA synthetase class 2